MAFKRMPQTEEARAQRQMELESHLRRMHDHAAFGNTESSQFGVQIVDHPIVEPTGSRTLIKARDEKGIVTLMLGGDRSPDTIFEPRTDALNRVLSDQPVQEDIIRTGVPSQVVGVEAMVGWDGKRDPKGPFRTIFVESMAFTIDGQTHEYGRPREADLVPPVKAGEKGGEVVDIATGRPRVESTAAKEAPANEAAPADRVAEDGAIFGGRKMRRMALDLSGDARTSGSGGVDIQGRNERGPVQLVLPGSRGQELGTSESGQALSGILAQGGTVQVEAEGFFRSRSWTDKAGTKQQAWDFVAATAQFRANGQDYVVGRPVAQEAQRAAPAAEASRARGRRDDRDAR